MEKINKKEIYNQVEKLLDYMKEKNSFNESQLSKFLNIDKNVNELILESSPSDFFQNYKIKKIEENLAKEFNATTIKDLAYGNNTSSKKVAMNMKTCEAWVIERKSSFGNKDIRYSNLPSFKGWGNKSYSEINESLRDGYHPILDDIDKKFYLEATLKYIFKELRKERLERLKERKENNINVIENFLQDLNKEDVVSSMANVNLNNTDPITNLNERINQVKQSLIDLSHDNKEFYKNKVLNAVTEFNKELLTKKEQEFNYDFER